MTDLTAIAATVRALEASLEQTLAAVRRLAEGIDGNGAADDMAMAELLAECALRGIVIAEDETVDEEACGKLIGRKLRTMINRRGGSSKYGPLIQSNEDARYRLAAILEYRKNRNR